MRREDLQAKYLAARKVMKEAQEKQKNSGALTEGEKKQFQSATYMYQACVLLQQELQSEKAAAAGRGAASGVSLTELLTKRLSAAQYEHFKRLSQALKVRAETFDDALRKLPMHQYSTPYTKC